MLETVSEGVADCCPACLNTVNIVVVEFLAFRIRGSRGKALNLVASPSELLGWVLCPVDFLLKLFQGQLLRSPLSVLDPVL